MPIPEAFDWVRQQILDIKTAIELPQRQAREAQQEGTSEQPGPPGACCWCGLWRLFALELFGVHLNRFWLGRDLRRGRCFINDQLFEQAIHQCLAPLCPGLFEQGVFLRQSGRLDIPVQKPAPKGIKQFMFAAGRGQEHHHPDIGARKILHQAGEQLNFVVWQGGGVVHDPYFGWRVLHLVAHGVLNRVGLQHLIEARDQGVGTGRETHLEFNFGRCFAQPGHQQFAVMVEDGVLGADHGQAHAALNQASDITL